MRGKGSSSRLARGTAKSGISSISDSTWMIQYTALPRWSLSNTTPTRLFLYQSPSLRAGAPGSHVPQKCYPRRISQREDFGKASRSAPNARYAWWTISLTACCALCRASTNIIGSVLISGSPRRSHVHCAAATFAEGLGSCWSSSRLVCYSKRWTALAQYSFIGALCMPTRN